ncbi:MAG: S9 family peptidase [Marinilabiliales bacterium]|nr:MAG: S9 family peptidase [Marinilabiliales bacterium]
MKKLFGILLLSIIVLQANILPAQDKLLTLDDINYRNRALFPDRIPQLQWIGDSDDYAFAEENAIYKVTAKRGTEKLLFDLDMINKEMYVNGFDSLNRLPSVSFNDDKTCQFKSGNIYFLYDFNTYDLKKINTIPDTAENIEFNDKTGAAAYTVNNNLYLVVDGKVKQITFDDDPGIVNGQTVHRNEFGITKGIFWSPSGTKIAFYRKDETMVTDYPLVNLDTRIAELANTKYPMAGMTSEEVTLGVYDLVRGNTVFMKTGEPKEQYLTSVSWGPDGKYIYIALLNRDQNHLKLTQYDVATGNIIKILFEEFHTKYVEPEDPIYFNPENSEEFIWISERDGYNHLYLHSATDGALLKQLTKGDWVVTDFLGFYGDQTVYFLGTKESPLEKNIYSVNLKDGNITRISPDHGTHGAQVSSDGKYILDYFSSIDVSREYKLLNQKGEVMRVLQENHDPLKEYKLGALSIFTLKSENGDDLYCRMIKPVDFDSAKKYPIFIYVYGGPHAQLISDSWLGGAQLFLYYMAQKGFVVFTLDNHGTANRGRDFEQSIFRNLGTLEVRDQMIGVDYLKSLPYVDPDRIGVDGWSYGGFMTISMMLKNPGVFKVGVAGGPVIDWQYYEIMYGERYMDTPQDNPEGYKNACLLNYVEDLQGKLMIIHGTNDPTVVWQNSLQFLKKAIEANKQMDYFVYPGHGHNVRGVDRSHMYEKISNYFIDNL